MDNLTRTDEINLKIKVSGLVIQLSAIVCSFLIQWYHITNHVFCVKSIVATLYLFAGILQCIETGLTTSNICKNTKDTTFNINYDTEYCHLGYVSTQIFGDVVPILIASDYIFNILANVRMRLLIFNTVVFTSTVCWFIVFIHYISEQTRHTNQNNITDNNDIQNQNGIHEAGKVGWLIVCAVSGLTVLLMLPPLYHALVWSKKIKTTIASTFSVLILTGMALSLVGINVLIFEYKFQTAIYAAIIAIVAFDLLTF